MTDDERAERAFAAALARAADGFDPADLDSAPPEPARRRWMPLVAAAAVVAVVAGLGVAVTQLVGDGQQPAPDSAKVADTASADLPVPDPGWHWESRRDLAVMVPDSWFHEVAPGSDWCADEVPGTEPTRKPYVDPWDRATVRLVACLKSEDSEISPEGVPERLWRTHVELEAAPSSDGLPGQPDGTYRQGRWTKVLRTIGSGRLTVVYDEDYGRTAGRVIASARQLMTVDQNGCPVTSGIQSTERGFNRPSEPFDITSIRDVDQILVCQYATAVPAGQPALDASRVIADYEADSVLHAIQAAPVGSGPNGPEHCLYHEVGDQAVVLRLESGGQVHEVYVQLGSCVGNGFDDGVTVRALTANACRPLWGAPVVMFYGGYAPAFDVCRPNDLIRLD